MLDIRYTVRRVPNSTRRLPFEKFAKAALPQNYSLSVVLCGDKLSRKLSRERRGKDHPANVLSFPLQKNEGEIFVNIRKAEREAKGLGIRTDDRVAHLFVHGMLHLKGHRHSDTMDMRERAIIKRFGFRAE